MANSSSKMADDKWRWLVEIIPGIHTLTHAEQFKSVNKLTCFFWSLIGWNLSQPASLILLWQPGLHYWRRPITRFVVVWKINCDSIIFQPFKRVYPTGGRCQKGLMVPITRNPCPICHLGHSSSTQDRNRNHAISTSSHFHTANCLTIRVLTE